MRNKYFIFVPDVHTYTSSPFPNGVSVFKVNNAFTPILVIQFSTPDSF